MNLPPRSISTGVHPQGVVGQEAIRSTLNDSDQFLATQIKMIQSDSVLRPVVEKYNLRDDTGKPENAASVTHVDPARRPSPQVT